jgi:hypothetical protein
VHRVCVGSAITTPRARRRRPRQHVRVAIRIATLGDVHSFRGSHSGVDADGERRRGGSADGLFKPRLEGHAAASQQGLRRAPAAPMIEHNTSRHRR